MDRKSKILIWVFIGLILGVVGFTYYRIMIKKDYLVQAELNCDPYTETCFVYNCDPEAEECTGDPEEDTWYYKTIEKRAYNIPDCDPNSDENCIISCEPGEEDCAETLCIDGDETCSDPVEYAKNNPIEEEAECEEGDEECLAAQESAEECEEGDEECLAVQDEEGAPEEGSEDTTVEAESESE